MALGPGLPLSLFSAYDGVDSSADHASTPIRAAKLVPLALVILCGTNVLRKRRRKDETQSTSLLYSYFAPFVTELDVKAERLRDHSAEDDSDSHLGFRRQRRRLNKLLAVVTAQSAAWTVRFGWNAAQTGVWLPSVSLGVSWTSIMLWVLLRPPQTAPTTLALLLFANLICALIDLLALLPLLPAWSISGVDTILSCYAMALCLQMPVTSGGYEAAVSPSEKALHQGERPVAVPQDMAQIYKLCPTSPEDYCSLYETLSYSWMAPIQNLALTRSLLPTDIWRLRGLNDTRLLFHKFQALGKSAPASSLLAKILRANANDILLDACFKLISVSFAYLGAYILKRILDEIQLAAAQTSTLDTEQWTPRQRAFVYAFIGLCLTVVRFLAELQNYHHARQVGLRLRSTLVVSLFEKALKRRDLSGQTGETADVTAKHDESASVRPATGLRAKVFHRPFASLRVKPKTRPSPKEAQKGADVGKVVNMMASDVNILLRMGCDLHQLYGAPFEVVIAAIFLYKLMGWSALVGFAILVAAIPINYLWGKVAVKKQREYSAARDERMSLMTELINAMRFIKIQGVETRWEQRVAEARRKEILRLIWSRVMTFLFELLWTTIPVLVTLISFFFYVKVAQQELTISTAFTAIALFTMIRPPLNAIPGFLMGGLIALVSVQRLESFLTEQEVDEAVSQLSSRWSLTAQTLTTQRYSDEPAVEDEVMPDSQLSIESGTFKWHSSDSVGAAAQLRDITVGFPAGELSLVIGPTGSGKSSLLAALLGEMLELTPGSVTRFKFDRAGHSRFSYASQLAWLESGKSVRDNITFATPYDKQRYDLCVFACALQDDIESMEDGDRTKIGSHTVSGGQKARISLARALYARSDTMLLDDVLSAVDTRVQSHIVKHAFQGPIAQGRRIVLVTHHAHLLLHVAEHVVYMEDGRILHQGKASDLQKRGLIAAAATSVAPVDSGNQSHLQPRAATDPGTRTPRLLYEDEKRRQGAVSWIFYKTYLKASALSAWALLVTFLVLLRLSDSFGQYWIKVWGEAYKMRGNASLAWWSLPPASGHASFYLSVYGLAGLAVVIFNSSKAVCFYVASIQASQHLFAKLLTNVVRAPLRWFDVTPAGRIMNRFGTDMDCVDNILPQSIMNLGNNAFSMAAYFLICVIIVPAFLLPSLALVLLGPWLVGGFLACTRDMQRIEATSTSPIYSHFQQALSGIMTIRAFGAEPRMLEALLDAVDLYQSLWWAVCTMEVWLSFRSQILGGVAVFVVTLLTLSGAVSPGSAGLALSSAQLLCQLAYYLINDFKNLANSFNSLERISEYQSMVREEPDVAEYDLPPAGWPSAQARIVFREVKLRYAPELPEVLKGVSFEILPGEKVGIIGRTGSGKSSLASSLFRATELSGGTIMIDDIDIRTVPLQELRNRLSIVMQDPVLFSGTIRDNLDPFGEYADDEIRAALRKVGLAAPLGEALIESISDDAAGGNNMHLRLETVVSSGGANFSAGQAQLISLARSLLRSTRILILDEATSSTDMQTDAMVQRVIRAALHGCIVICIAHRLRSVIDYDRILVMQDGQLVEFGRPQDLLAKPDDDATAYFKDLCRHSSERPPDGLQPVNGLPIHDDFSCAVDSGCRFVSRAYSTWLDHYTDLHKRQLPDRLLGLPLREFTHYKCVRVQTLSSFSRLVDYFVVDAPPLLVDTTSDNPKTSVLGTVNIARQRSPSELDAHDPTQPLAGTEQIRADMLKGHRPTIPDDECVDARHSQLEVAETCATETDQIDSDLGIDYSQEDKQDLENSNETASDYDQLELDSTDNVDFGVDTSSSCETYVLPDLSMTTELAGVCLVPEHQAAAFLDLTIDSDAEEDNRVHLHARQRELKRFTVSLPEATVPKASPVLSRQSLVHEAQSSDAEAFGTRSWSTEISDGTSENSAPSVRSQGDAVGDFVLAADFAKSAKMRIPVSGRIALDSSGQSASHAEELRTHASRASVEDARRVNVEKEKYRQQFANFRRLYNVDKKEAYSILVQFRGSITEAWDYVDRWCRDMSSRHLLDGNAAFDYLKAADGNFRIAEACIKVTARFPASTSKRSMSSRDMHCDEDPCRSKKARRRTDHR